MKRVQVLSLLVAAGGTAFLLSTRAESQTGAFKNYVALQSSTPGTVQSGHLNVSGAARAGLFVGPGTGLTNLDADNLSIGTVNAARLPAATAYLVGAQTFTGLKTFAAKPSFTDAAGPFTVASNQLVANLNADQLDGLEATSFAQLAATQTWTGANTFSNAGNSFTGNGAGLTGLSASNIATGTLSDSRLSGNVALLGLNQTFSASKTFSGTVNFTNFTAFTVPNTNLITNLNADFLDGFSSSSFVRTLFPITLTGSSTSHGLQVDNANGSNTATAIMGVASSTTGNVWGVYGESRSVDGIAVRGFANSPTGSTTAGSFTATSPTSTGVTASGGLYGIRGFSSENGGRGVEGVSNGSSGNGVFGRVWVNAIGSANYGGWFENFSGSGGGLRATGNALYTINADNTLTSGAAYGLFANVVSTSGTAIYASASATTGDTAAGSFINSSSAGRAVVARTTSVSGATYAGHFTNNSTAGSAVYAAADNSTAIRGSALNYGADLTVDGSFGMGILATASHATGTTYGGTFRSNSSSGTGVFGHANATTGTTYGLYGRSDSVSGTGVYGWASDVTVGSTIYGVYGRASAATLGFGVYALGDMGASGVKPFRIDHPLDPENKYLLHYAAESPFPQNFYNGNVRTDEQGFAWVELPDYFDQVNTNFKYVLTVIDNSEDFVMAKVTNEIQNNRFRIRTSKPNIKVSWRVDADRNDLRIRANRPTDERVKTGTERGKYQHPEYYGLGNEYGMADNVDRGAERKAKPTR